jgi:hypothetical protein
MESTKLSCPLFTGYCYSLFKAGYRHETTSYRESIRVSDKSECAAQCARLTFCRSFSYEYFGGGPSSRNCLLSPEKASSLNFVDMRVESNWDIYNYDRDIGNCNLESEAEGNYASGIGGGEVLTSGLNGR